MNHIWQYSGEHIGTEVMNQGQGYAKQISTLIPVLSLSRVFIKHLKNLFHFGTKVK